MYESHEGGKGEVEYAYASMFGRWARQFIIWS
jgi:hypothetical protein